MRSNRPYVQLDPAVIEQARQMDLLTYLQHYEPSNLRRVAGNVYCTREHDSLKISNGKWYWWSRGFGGVSALDYLIKVKEYSFVEAVQTLTGEASNWIPPPPAQKKEEPKELLLPKRFKNCDRVVQYLFGRGIDYQLIQDCVADCTIFESAEYHNAVFVGKDESGTPKYAACRSTLGSTFKQDASGSDKRYSFRLLAKEPTDTVHLFEAAIDLLSYATYLKCEGNADVIIIDPEREYSPLVKAMQGEVIHISATSENHINAMDMNSDYGDGANPVILKSEFILSLCEQLIGGSTLGAKQKSIIDRCTASVYRHYQQGNYMGVPPTLQDFREELLKQNEPEAQEIALAIELFTDGSLNTFAKHTNVDTHSRLICYDILDLGKQLQPIGMLVVLDSILNRITQNRAKGRNTFIFIDEIYLLFQHEYSANFLFTLWKRVRKYGAYCTGITQNVDDLLQSHTARTMLANSEFIIMLNQASTDRLELAKLLNISDLQMSYITNVGAGQGLLKVGSSLVPFVNKFPRNTELYRLMTTKFGEV